MSKVLIVAWRDFKQTVMRKIFLLAIVGIPVLIAGAAGIAFLLMLGHEQPPLIGTIAIIDPTGEVTTAARRELDPDRVGRERTQQIKELSETIKQGGTPTTFDMGVGTGRVEIKLTQHEKDALKSLKQQVSNGQLLAVAVIDEVILATPDPAVDRDAQPRFELFVGDNLDDDHVGFVERRLGRAIVRVRAARAGLDADEAMAMLRRPGTHTIRMMEGGNETAESEGIREFKAMIPAIFMMLLWAATFTSGQHLMMSTIEEKSNRVMEVLLSAVSPLQLMTGKILGQGGVGLLIVGIYSALGIGALAVFGALHSDHLWILVLLFVYFFMAYFMIASIMAAVGSAVTDIREANTLFTPVMIVVMIPLILWLPISQAPNGAIAITFSFIPPAIPFIMILRLAADEWSWDAWWQLPATIAWGYICVVGMVWMAAKIFRVGVLMYGKPPSPWQLLKWLRYP